MLTWPNVLRWGPSVLAGGALLVAVWWLVSVVQERAELRADLAIERVDRIAAEAALERAEEAARVHRAWLDRHEQEAAHWRAVSEDLANMEGGDAPLSDYLRAAAGRLWE